MAFAKNCIVGDIILNERLSDLPQPLVSIVLDDTSCTRSEDEHLCNLILEGQFEVGNISPALADRLLASNAPIIRVNEGWASTITYAVDVESRTLHKLYGQYH